MTVILFNWDIKKGAHSGGYQLKFEVDIGWKGPTIPQDKRIMTWKIVVFALVAMSFSRDTQRRLCGYPQLAHSAERVCALRKPCLHTTHATHAVNITEESSERDQTSNSQEQLRRVHLVAWLAQRHHHHRPYRNSAGSEALKPGATPMQYV